MVVQSVFFFGQCYHGSAIAGKVGVLKTSGLEISAVGN